MEIWLITILLLMFGLFEFLASFSFNIKIKMINNKKYTNAAALGAFSTVLFMTLALTAPIVADAQGSIWFIFAGAGMMAFGNALSLILLRPFEKWWSNRFDSGLKDETDITVDNSEVIE